MIGHEFGDLSLLGLALTHSSYTAEHDDEPSNERLEFLGDAVVGLVLADEMYRRHADFDEGVLTDLRKSVVNAQTLAIAARRLGLGKFVRLGRGESTSGGADKTSILANAFEAVIGAVYLDAGIDVAYDLSLRLLAPEIAGAVPGLRMLDPKTQLQEITAEFGLGVPSYVLEDEGPDHDKTFFAEVLVAGRRRGSGSGRTKKAAEQQAAAEAIESLRAHGS
ncbi:MAG: ribonuclease III [Actinomycetota bacterium]